MLDDILKTKETKKVYQWELDVVKNWTVSEIKNRIWSAKECRMSIPSSVSIEALRVELLRRNETPNGYHEEPEEVDMSNIEIVREQNIPRRRGR